MYVRAHANTRTGLNKKVGRQKCGIFHIAYVTRHLCCYICVRMVEQIHQLATLKRSSCPPSCLSMRHLWSKARIQLICIMPERLCQVLRTKFPDNNPHSVPNHSILVAECIFKIPLNSLRIDCISSVPQAAHTVFRLKRRHSPTHQSNNFEVRGVAGERRVVHRLHYAQTLPLALRSHVRDCPPQRHSLHVGKSTAFRDDDRPEGHDWGPVDCDFDCHENPRSRLDEPGFLLGGREKLFSNFGSRLFGFGTLLLVFVLAGHLPLERAFEPLSHFLVVDAIQLAHHVVNRLLPLFLLSRRLLRCRVYPHAPVGRLSRKGAAQALHELRLDSAGGEASFLESLLELFDDQLRRVERRHS
mmetsp:Transcript_4546/g.8277  ORF Transcript_4546/g.8277 Transcript_4546/m.8277 type:complete len:357 (-) Transcript_4546:1810-2880(-)